MSHDVEQIAEDLLKLPSSSRAELAERLLGSIEDFTTPDVEQAWKNEVAKRIKEYESGVVQCIPATDVFKAAREKSNEGRGLSS
ncbi:MAG: addiction module protein [Nitrospirae bacterium]|nr:addiction module protein [Nitrospirota bacterium]MDA1304127.1 addiction module protein [Nitrospirota bacterium]